MGSYVHSKCIGLCLLSASVQYDRCMCDDCRTGNREQRNFENVGPASQPLCPFNSKILYTAVLSAYGNGCFSCGFCDNRIVCNAQYRTYRNTANRVFAEVVRGFISYHAPQYGDHVGGYDTI